MLCLHGSEWIYLSLVGNVFGTLHQLLVLMQINITQYVLVRIPRNMGLFDVAHIDMKHSISHSLRSQLLNTAINDQTGAEQKWEPSMGTQGMTLGQLLRKIKESQMTTDDNFRA